MPSISFEVAGALYYRLNEVQSLRKEHPDWKKSVDKLIEEGKTDKYIYKYRYFRKPADLVYEPSNTHNPNAVMVFVDGIQIGYVPEYCLDEVRSIMKNAPSFSITVKIFGGERKKVTEDRAVYMSETELNCDAEITYQPFASSSVRSAPKSSSQHVGKQKNKWIAFFLCLFFGYIGAHKFYEGKIGMGILYFFTLGLFCIGWIKDIFTILAKPDTYYV